MSGDLYFMCATRLCLLDIIAWDDLGMHVANDRCEARLDHRNADTGNSRETEAWRVMLRWQ